MNNMCVRVVAMAVMLTLPFDSEASSIRPSLVGLKHAQEMEEKFQIIERILANSTTAKKCDSLERTKLDHTSTKEDPDETEMESTSEEIPLYSTDIVEKEFIREEHTAASSEDEEDDEDCDYEEIHINHTMLLPPTECNVTDTSMTDEEKELILKLHNELRSKVAAGNETQGEPGPQPSAANMHQLVWNEELAKVAQAWAAQCPTGHDEEKRRRLCSRKYRIGQNINYYWGVYDDGPLWEKAINNWYNEVKDVDAKVASSFAPHTTKKIGHYTQLIWGTSKEIGCGIVYYRTERKGFVYNASITHVCNYGPAGNVLTKPLYEIGKPASKCPGEASSEYPALCI